MLLCGECGNVPQCPRCSVPLTYHSANGRLMCHHCGHSEQAPRPVPGVRGTFEACGQRHPEGGGGAAAALSRTRRSCGWTPTPPPSGHEPILRRFQEERIPILLGTQMVAKGLDFPGVTLVGVLAADLSACTWTTTGPPSGPSAC